MEFRLLYVGRVLGASRTNTRADLKHEIRREFHPQLRRLWQTNPNLREMTKRIGYEDMMDKCSAEAKKVLATSSGRFQSRFPGPSQIEKEMRAMTERYRGGDDLSFNRHGVDLLLKDWSRNGYTFLPLVTERFCVRCSLDILFLRPEEPGLLINSGDIDARVKTVFDALRMPKNLQEAGGIGPQDDEIPF
ncbi:MAG: hypothetical protein WBM04_06070 [Candidatus Korobacteraceae bacterium]